MQKLEKIYKILFVKLLRVYNLIICKTKQKTAPLEGQFFVLIFIAIAIYRYLLAGQFERRNRAAGFSRLGICW